MKTWSLLIFGICLMAMMGTAKAEGGCPQGQTPVLYGSVWGCAPGGTDAPVQQGQSAAAPPQPSGEWKTTWGAIATDGPRGILGAVTEMENEKLAQTTALNECQRQGGNSCKLQATYYNHCAALVTGDKVFFVNLGASEEEASSTGMQKCTQEDVHCRVYYSACSKPQFIRY